MPARIMVVDDEASNRTLLLARLRAACYEAAGVASAADALARAQSDTPDLILISVSLEGGSGCELCRKLKQIPELRDIPLVLLTRRNTAEERLRGLEAGADDFLSRPIADLELFARVRSLVRTKTMLDELRLRDGTLSALDLPGAAAPDPGPAEVALLCADPAHARARGRILEAEMPVRVLLPQNERELLHMWSEGSRPDALVLERDLGPGRDGLRLIPELRARGDDRHSAILMLVRRGDLEGAAAALDFGANDFLTAPFDGMELAARLAGQIRRKRAADRLRDNLRSGLTMAVTDPLTGLWNRRYAETHLPRLAEQCAEAGLPLAVMLMDLDRFKSVNDRFGHAAGDEVLQEFARRLRANVRGVDLVARVGGEEFMVAMPDADARGAQRVAERIRAAVAASPFPIAAAPGALSVTVSAGLAISPPSLPQSALAAAGIGGMAEDAAPRISGGGAAPKAASRPRRRPTEDLPRLLLEDADKALYASKNAGRNMVTTYDAA